MRRRISLCGIFLLGVFWMGTSSSGPEYGSRLGIRRGEQASLVSQGISVLSDALYPSLRKWYVPQELIAEYPLGGWEYTNYARDFYQRYYPFAYEGDYFYDLFGEFITRGWMVYDWTRQHPRKYGSTIWQGGIYGIFRTLVIAADSKGEYQYALSVGDEIRTVLTPMTFSKPGFNGLKWDVQFEEYGGTFLLSRINAPGVGVNPFELPDKRTNTTQLFGGRITRGIGDFARIGGTYLNAHQSHTEMGFLKGDLIRGDLTEEQNARYITFIRIALSDDSPEDGEGGCAFFWEDVLITDVEGNTVRGSEIEFHPRIEGGSQRIRHLAADGNEVITLTYDFESPHYTGPEVSKIHHVSFELVLANDYRVEVTSSQQTNRQNKPVYLMVARSRKNVKDKTNPVMLRFDYGLPTANTLFGFTVEAEDVQGFSLYGEFDFNTQYGKYPNRDVSKHHVSETRADAWMVNASYQRYPWLVFCELFHMDYNYSTTSFIANKQGVIDYEDETLNFYEFVDDNDDGNRSPEWRRLNHGGGGTAMPGLDENGDFISDFNQNRNLIPDYEEPFLRYACDRPEYLFGMDMNNNGWMDRFENDNLADYPYKRDHEGYNMYLQTHLRPDARIIVGQERQLLVSQGRRNLTTYGLFLLDTYPRWGRLRIFERIKQVKDTIPDDVYQWVQPVRAKAMEREFRDPLSHQNAWVNTTFLGYEIHHSRDFRFINNLKYEVLHQRDADRLLEVRDVNRNAHLFGLINKMDYILQAGDWSLIPRWKSEFFLQTPYLKDDPERRELRETFSLIAKVGFARWHKARVYRRTSLEMGIEWTYFDQLEEPAPEGLEDDFVGMVFVGQFTSYTTYMGYRTISQLGYRMNWKMYEGEQWRKTGTVFAKVIAGIQE